ncbi:TIGR03936 family radical SAM-associated protein [Oscillospiraceae bacterium MB08-C2-2]|nr:TIGR03936 family radical SAM-associated protein [Oscillospiraceae bacterium MB08-C2-2]
MIPVRIFYRKAGRAKYLAHLDLMRSVSRAIKRSGLPVWYTQGFNPHMYLTFSLPLSLGYEGMWETVDIRLNEEICSEEIISRLSPCLPAGFEIFRVSTPVQEPSAIEWADYHVELLFDEEGADRMSHALARLMEQPEILVMKKAKKGPGRKILKEVDIRPMVQLLEQKEGENCLDMTLRLRTGLSQNLNPSLFLDALYKEAEVEPDLVRIARVAVLDDHLHPFE